MLSYVRHSANCSQSEFNQVPLLVHAGETQSDRPVSKAHTSPSSPELNLCFAGLPTWLVSTQVYVLVAEEPSTQNNYRNLSTISINRYSLVVGF